ncbi:MAG: hypothetical protein OXR68_07935 [Alphaproteobacteria bacterium]|nr:hypothetical protein [Alphaproteobacteria bacterium]MDD9920534.1 hypothetical protein [Alphaproteobacteria bacterium]
MHILVTVVTGLLFFTAIPHGLASSLGNIHDNAVLETKLSAAESVLNALDTKVDEVKTELENRIGNIENCHLSGQIYASGGCRDPQRVVQETDPKVGALWPNMMCRSDGQQIICDRPAAGGGNSCRWYGGLETGNSFNQTQIECPFGWQMRGLSIYGVHNCERIGGSWECDRFLVKCCR